MSELAQVMAMLEKLSRKQDELADKVSVSCLEQCCKCVSRSSWHLPCYIADPA